MVTAADLEHVLREKLQASHVEVVDTSSGCGTSFEVVVVSAIFAEKKGLLQKHRAVNEAVKEHMAEIHAFSIKKAVTPEQWQQQQQQ
mmetsp:Transcript_12159/g.44384  ORF Transcript_12159/g.44384 Transcript_12159/m.44384 type:complete len:87 (+) Transcript_12159:139-399(+)